MSDVELAEGYVPGAIGRVAQLHGRYYHEHWGFGLYFEAKVATELADFLGRYDAGRDGFWTQLDALCESDDTRRFPAWLRDQGGSLVSVEVSLTRYARRTRTLALALLRPRNGGGGT